MVTGLQTILSNIVKDSQGNDHVFNMGTMYGGYYFTIDGIKLDWSFPSVCYSSAIHHYNIIANSRTEVDSVLNWVKG